MIRLFVNGIRGRMGTRIAALARADDRFLLGAADDATGTPSARGATAPRCDVIVDFSSPQGTMEAARQARTHDAALVVGTTGLSRENLDVLDDAARFVPLMITPNFAPGATALTRLATAAARLLGPGCDLRIIEHHHRSKRDAPSGTALRLAEALNDEASVHVAPEHIHSIRAGDVIGEHAVLFSGGGEIVTIFHSVADRDVFALGALRAAAWLSGRRPGRYHFIDVLAEAREEPAGRS
jgi:4-hydroxy-tetrahydrodipicolinate reductase